jgi:hypothetical protein
MQVATRVEQHLLSIEPHHLDNVDVFGVLGCGRETKPRLQ